jgi:hypothetical protein
MYRIAMDVPFNPKEILLRLLGPSPSHPWAALIPQVILWSFQQFCLQKLIVSDGNLEESLCDDTLELVHKYCPKGLEVVSVNWLTPDNIEKVFSPLDEYTKFFRVYCKEMDISIDENDYKKQDLLSEFLDESMGTIVRSWLDEKHKSLLIFPIDLNINEFTEGQFTHLIDALLQYSYKSNSVKNVSRKRLSLWEVLSIAKKQPPHQERTVNSEDSVKIKIPPVPELYPEQPIPEENAAVQKAEAEPEPEAEPHAVQAVEASAAPISRALARRRTLCKHGRRSEESRVKTRKLNRASY